MKSIMYHYVQKDNLFLPSFNHLHVDDFIKQLQYFASNFGFVSQEDFLICLERGTPLPGVVLTFDDGLKCHYSEVFPILKNLGIWGIFYVPTGVYQKKKLLDVHRIHLLLGLGKSEEILDYLKNSIKPEYLTDINRKEFTEKTYQIQQNDEATFLIKRILNYYISYEFRESVLDEMCDVFVPKKLTTFSEFYVNENELVEMEKEGMIIGSHTVNHPVLSKLDDDIQRNEIVHSFEDLIRMGLSIPLKTFCYPYGGFHSFTSATEQILNEENCLFSFNVESRDIYKHDLQYRKQALPRYDCNEFPYGQIRRLKKA